MLVHLPVHGVAVFCLCPCAFCAACCLDRCFTALMCARVPGCCADKFKANTQRNLGISYIRSLGVVHPNSKVYFAGVSCACVSVCLCVCVSVCLCLCQRVYLCLRVRLSLPLSAPLLFDRMLTHTRCVLPSFFFRY